MLSKERLGKFTASEIHKLFVGGKGKTRDSYIFSKAEEIIKGHGESFSSPHTEHGHLNEFEGIENFKTVSGMNVVYLEQEYFPINRNCGSTPDARIVDFNGRIIASMDIKCPTETFFSQKMMMIGSKNPDYQNVPKPYFYQGQMQMMSLNVDKHYLVRYMTSTDVDYDGNKIEYDLPLDVRIFYKIIEADKKVQDEILEAVEIASKERDVLVDIFKTPIL